MTKIQKIAILAFVVFSLALFAYAVVIFAILHLHPFQCDTAYPGYTCNQAIWIAWFKRLGAPIIIWCGISVALYLKWGR